MTHDELQHAARRQPFRPFRVILATGDAYDIRHPDMIVVEQDSAIIGIAGNIEAAVFERSMKVDLKHIVGIENLPGSPSSSD